MRRIFFCPILKYSEASFIVSRNLSFTGIRIAKAFEMKELFGFSVREIAAEFQLSEPRVYQLIARAKAIGREYRQENG